MRAIRGLAAQRFRFPGAALARSLSLPLPEARTPGPGRGRGAAGRARRVCPRAVQRGARRGRERLATFGHGKASHIVSGGRTTRKYGLCKCLLDEQLQPRGSQSLIWCGRGQFQAEASGLIDADAKYIIVVNRFPGRVPSLNWRENSPTNLAESSGQTSKQEIYTAPNTPELYCWHHMGSPNILTSFWPPAPPPPGASPPKGVPPLLTPFGRYLLCTIRES